MARALRIERVGGRHHVVARGNERRAIFREEERLPAAFETPSTHFCVQMISTPLTR